MEIANDWHYPEPYDFYDMKNDPEDYEEILSPEKRGGHYYQVLKDGALYGFFCLIPSGEGSLELGLGLKPEHCGQGQGAAFLEGILDFARENFSVQKLTLSVADFNQRAQKLYLNLGFAAVRRVPKESNGDIHLFVEMEKDL
ncbi:Ribosomal-protein-alanine acetyltransferase [Streptococcus sp. DD11]|nr:Ribosomal-protein-alanine acetyltransferase [Streptococcus sp. DD11]